jgi:hypothetical protein
VLAFLAKAIRQEKEMKEYKKKGRNQSFCK